MNLSEFTVKGLTLYGVKFESTNTFTMDGKRIVKISVPEFSDMLNKDNQPMSGDVLAKRSLRIIKDAGFSNIVLMSRTRRGERWTKEDHDRAVIIMQNSYRAAHEDAVFGNLV